MVVVSRLESPVTVGIPPTDRPADGEENPPLDTFEDLTNKNTLLAVCISGGGARAARMGLYAMSMIESNYNARIGTKAAKANPLVDKIDIISSVSGGSVYSSWIATYIWRRQHWTNSSDLKLERNPKSGQLLLFADPSRTFENLLEDNHARHDTKELGAWAAVVYLSPGNFFAAPFAQLFTEWDTLNLFADTHAILQGNLAPFLGHRHLGELPAKPRFYFNSTCLVSGRPFVFSREAIHDEHRLDIVPSDPLKSWMQGDWSDGTSEPLQYAMTLEDIGSSPVEFPSDYAVLASAAFPGVFEPLMLKVYARHRIDTTNGLGTSSKFVSLVDGGVYDNTGVTTALTLFDYLKGLGVKKSLILLRIDANNTFGNYDGETDMSLLHRDLHWPIRGLVKMTPTLDQIYDDQQSLVDTAIDLKLSFDHSDIKVYKIALNEVKDPDVKRKLADIHTDFAISGTEDQTIQQSVTLLLNHEDKTGKSTVNKLVDALVEER